MGRLRGRTFNNTFVIVDEAQNTTAGKMRMAVTRIGHGTRMVITGDPAQIDLHDKESSGLPHLLRLIEGTHIASVHKFGNKQIVRSDLVRRLEEIYSHDIDSQHQS
jgi:phosphate starvation-inducible PhoH-like protein